MKKSKQQKIIGIYNIINKTNNKLYVGSSENIYERFEWHKDDLRKNEHHSKYLQRAWNKYKQESFDFVIIQECKSKEEALCMEQLWLDYYAFTNKRWKQTYNVSKKAGGGNLGEEVNKKISRVQKERLKDPAERAKLSGENNGMWHKKHTPEACAKMSASRTGKKHSEERKAKQKIIMDEVYKSEGFRQKVRGENNPRAKLTEQQVYEIKCYINQYNELKVTRHAKRLVILLAEKYNATIGMIEGILAYHSWKHIEKPAEQLQAPIEIKQKKQEIECRKKTKEEISAALRAALAKPEVKAKMSAVHKNKKISVKQRAQISVAISGENNGMAKLTKEDVIKIRELYKTIDVPKKLKKIELAKIFNVTRESISNIIGYRTWKNV